MANTFLTPSIIAREALMLLESNMVATALFDRQYQAEFSGNEKVGSTISIRRRDRGVVVEYNGTTVTPTDVVETPITLVLEKHFDATIKVTSVDMTLNLQDFSNQVLAPYVLEIAEVVDAYSLTKLADLPNVAGPSETTLSTLPDSIADMAMIDRRLNTLKVPTRGRVQIASPEYKESLLGVTSFVEADKSGSTVALREASLGRIMGFDTFMDQNTPTALHTSGTATAGTLSADALKGASIIAVTGMGNATTLKASDILNLATYGGVVVAADITLNASGQGNVTIREPLRQLVASGSAVTPYAGTDTWTLHGAAFHPRAFAFASVPLALPRGAAAAANMQDRGLSIRVVYDYDRNLKSDVISLDVLVGARMVDGRLGAQILKA